MILGWIAQRYGMYLNSVCIEQFGNFIFSINLKSPNIFAEMKEECSSKLIRKQFCAWCLFLCIIIFLFVLCRVFSAKTIVLLWHFMDLKIWRWTRSFICFGWLATFGKWEIVISLQMETRRINILKFIVATEQISYATHVCAFSSLFFCSAFSFITKPICRQIHDRILRNLGCLAYLSRLSRHCTLLAA